MTWPGMHDRWGIRGIRGLVELLGSGSGGDRAFPGRRLLTAVVAFAALVAVAALPGPGKAQALQTPVDASSPRTEAVTPAVPAATGAAHAPIPPQEPRVLTLAEAQELAAVHNPDYRTALAEMDLSDAGQRAAWGAFLPSLNLYVGTGLDYNRRLTSTDNFGNPIQNPVTEWRTTSRSAQSASADLTLFQGGQRFHDLSAERARADARAQAASLELLTIVARVERQYHATLEQSELLAVEEQILAGKRLDRENTERLFRIAAASRVDVLAAELAVGQQERAVRQVRNDYEKALLALRTVVAAPELDDFAVTASGAAPFDPADLEPDALVERALTGNARIRQQEAQISVERAGVRSSRGSRWPTVSLGLSFFQSAFATENAALFDPFPDEGRYASADLQISIPAFSRFQNENRIAESEVRLVQAQQAVRRTLLEVEENIRSQLIDLEAAYETLRLAERSREIAEERLRLAREEYRLAARSFSDLQQAIEEAATERRAAIQARYDFFDARITLEETVGGAVAPAPAPPGGR